ncbi:hypothetical protein FRC02_007706 [Tulasnella sp. 418]|nr:hypothetical protein FRC02_007706 [Tulasnella sp. 418]
MRYQLLWELAGILALMKNAGVMASTTCSADKHCPKSAPCSYHVIDTVELGLILLDAKAYEGNATTHDFVVDSGTTFITTDSELVLTLKKENNGTRISTTRYVHYGVITARLKTARSPGVVNAFITMSDVKDEIDWEWPGTATSEAQSNYFWLGVVDYSHTNGETHKGLSDTFSNFHDYTIDWQPDVLKFSIDGQVVRTVNKEDTRAADGHYAYPTTPARVQLSIWPAGIPSSAPGTVEWAGGMINWNDPDYVAQGHFGVIVKSVDIKCTPETAQTNPNGTIPKDAQSYIYMSNDTETGVTPRVYVSNHTTNVNAAAGRIGMLVTGGKTMVTMAGGAALLAVAGLLI